MNPNRLRAAIRMLYPAEMTPTARNVLERILDEEYEAPVDAGAFDFKEDVTMTRADEIKARLAAATPGPWYVSTGGVHAVNVKDPLSAEPICELPWEHAGTQTQKNKAFIAHAPEDIAYLLSELERASK